MNREIVSELLRAVQPMPRDMLYRNPSPMRRFRPQDAEMSGYGPPSLEDLIPDPNPEDFGPMDASTMLPDLQSEDDAYTSRWDRILPVLGQAAQNIRVDHSSQKPGPLALAAIRGLAMGLGQRRQGDVEKRLRTIRKANDAQVDGVKRVNAAAEDEAKANRADLRQAKGEVRRARLRKATETTTPTKRELTPAEQAQKEADLERERRKRGVHVPGDRAPSGPDKPAKFTPTAWRFLSDADKLSLEEVSRPVKDYEDAVKDARSNPVLARALEPLKRDASGRPVKENTAVSAARTHLNQLRTASEQAAAAQREIYVDAAIAQLSMLPEAPAGQSYVIDQVRRMAKRFKFDSDPDFMEALQAVTGGK